MSRHVLVTGGGSGIGAAIARRCAAAGYRVSLLGRRSVPLEAVAGGLAAQAAGIVSADVTDDDALTRALLQLTSTHGPVEILVNSAGAAPTAPFRKLDEQQWSATLDVNLNGPVRCMRALLPGMEQAGWGRIVNIGSTAALIGYRYVSVYCAAKHGLLGVTRALALELAQSGITVNMVCPGYTDTDIIRGAVDTIVRRTGRSPEEALRTFTDVNPQGRLVSVEQVAATALWLMSEDSDAVTGQAISVSGGEVMS